MKQEEDTGAVLQREMDRTRDFKLKFNAVTHREKVASIELKDEFERVGIENDDNIFINEYVKNI